MLVSFSSILWDVTNFVTSYRSVTKETVTKGVKNAFHLRSIQYSFGFEVINQFLDGVYNSAMSALEVAGFNTCITLHIPGGTIIHPLKFMNSTFSFVFDHTILELELNRRIIDYDDGKKSSLLRSIPADFEILQARLRYLSASLPSKIIHDLEAINTRTFPSKHRHVFFRSNLKTPKKNIGFDKTSFKSQFSLSSLGHSHAVKRLHINRQNIYPRAGLFG